LISCFLVYPWVLSIILSGEDEFIKNSGVMSIVRLRWRGSILIRGRHVSDKDPLGAGLPLRQQAGFENRHAGPDGGWWTVDGQVDVVND
jgi:hypothetical protein